MVILFSLTEYLTNACVSGTKIVRLDESRFNLINPSQDISIWLFIL